jgi:acyl carrier protein phosphodiesterase
LNYLVHLYLAGPDPELQLGGMMGDFVKGAIPDHYSEKLTLGLILHRRIDSLAHNSPHTRRSRQRLKPDLRHGRGIIVDIFYDHFLASAWPEFSPMPLADYAGRVYCLLRDNYHRLPPGLQSIAPRMIEYNWLVSYRHREVVGRALHRIAGRLSRPLPLEQALSDLATHEEALRRDFAEFMAEAVDFVKREFAVTAGGMA